MLTQTQTQTTDEPDGAIDESWAAFKLQDGDYIDMGSWKEGPGGEDAN